MFNGGHPWRMPVNPAPQNLNNPRPFIMSDPSALNHFGGNPAGIVPSLDMQNVGADFHEAYSKKLEDDLKEIGQKIKHHEDNVKFLKALKKNLDESILDKEDSLASYDKTSTSATMEVDPAHLTSEEVTIENILKHENSAAALCFRLKKEAETTFSDHSLTKDVIGVVATLGKVDDDNLSRLLSKYLGSDTMLAVVCKTYEGVKTLEAYQKGGLIDQNFGIHAFAASTGMPLADQFAVISLEDIRPYAGELVDDDPQRRLALLKPKLPNGETPSGFLGFAVNMIKIDRNDLHYNSKNGHNLRETLFYHLFSNLQVYRSREDMLLARSCISNGAISLDGGVVGRPGSFTLGHNLQDIDVKFPIGCEKLNAPEGYYESIKELKETKWKRDQTIEDMQMEEKLLGHAKLSFEKKKRALLQFIAERTSQMSQTQYQVGRGSTSK